MHANYFALFFRACAVSGLFACTPLFAGDVGGLEIHGIRFLSATKTHANVEVEYSLDFRPGPATVTGRVESDDKSKLSRRSHFSYGAALGRNVRMPIYVERAVDHLEHVTDTVVISFFFTNANATVSRSFRQKIAWPKLYDPDKPVASELPLYQASSLGQVFSDYYIFKDFNALDSIVAHWARTGERDIDGNWKLGHFAWGLQQWFMRKRWQEDQQALREWKRASPKSVALPLVEATFWLTYGKSIFGNEYKPSQDPLARKISHERLGKAEEALLSAKAYAAKNPLWYELYIAVSSGLGRDERFMQSLFAEATARFPTYLPIYAAMNSHLAPLHKKDADWMAIDEVIGLGVKNTKASEDNIAYATLYLGVAYRRGDTFDLFRETKISWLNLKWALETRASKYPSPDNLNESASLACVAGDRAAYIKIRPHVRLIIPQLWRSNFSPDLCDRKFLSFS